VVFSSLARGLCFVDEDLIQDAFKCTHRIFGIMLKNFFFQSFNHFRII
jgi:hypothetical protein